MRKKFLEWYTAVKKRRIQKQIAKWLPSYHLHRDPVRKEKANGNERVSDVAEK